ncbi:YeiH family protein [Selenomonas ruminis]|uniref:YeiH family putative sulfate export transporter n=1 Tax=Selenomonas ruminis TaxID=2593411 RepID=A0A5D6WAQ6_9FIRM|nr:YeiH family protein [Selenomonas sp. mPRGC5]TYZ25007.1 YeiH family putative sulfate export transporter [Selenomonas sp. mPRGC5]
MLFLRNNSFGIFVCFLIALPAWLLGKLFPVVGGAVLAILFGMVITFFWHEHGKAQAGINWTSKIILQSAVVLLGFGMNLGVIVQTGIVSLPIIVSTITTSLVVALVLHRGLDISRNTSALIGVGSSICGGSAIAAAAPVVKADSNEIAQSISVIFLFNAMAALLFPILGHMIGFDTTSGEAFGIFAGTAINDTSSVTAAAATWDSMWGLGTQTLDEAVTVKLTRALAIIPVTLLLAMLVAKKEAAQNEGSSLETFSLKRAFPMFILYFVLAAVVTTVCLNLGVSADVFQPLKELAKFFIVMAMAAIGLNSNVVKLIKTGGKPILLGACCWAGITVVSLLVQRILGIW